MTLVARLEQVEQSLGGGKCPRCHGCYVAVVREGGDQPQAPLQCPECGGCAVLVRRYVRAEAEQR